MLLKTLFRLFFPENILNRLGILGRPKEPGSPHIHHQQPLLAPGSTVQPLGGLIPDGASQSGDNIDGTLPPGADDSISNGNAIIDIPGKPVGTTQGTKHPMEPIIGGIQGTQNVTSGQYPGGDVQSSRMEILKSIVYGGLVESITSLGIVSSAAASDVTTLNIVVLGLANLIGGLVVLFHNLKELRYEESNEANEDVKSKYQQLLGRKENFVLHSIFAVLSFLVFGVIPPVVYGFTFRETNDRDFKILAVAASSLVCIVILAIAKAYTHGQHKFTAYTKTMLYYVSGAVMGSGIAYAVGHFFGRLMDGLGWFDSNPVKHLSIPENKTWASF